jgi:hypothetical protein
MALNISRGAAEAATASAEATALGLASAAAVGATPGLIGDHLDWWNSCSPAVKVKVFPQSEQVRVLSL